MPRRRLVGAGIFMVAIGVALASCSSDNAQGVASAGTEPALPPSVQGTTEREQATTTPPLSPEQEVLEAVDGYWHTYFEANNPPNPAHPGYTRFFTGDALDRSVANTENRRETGRAIRQREPSGFSTRPEVIELLEGRATVRDCVVDDSLTIDQATGLVLNDATYTFDFRLTLLMDGSTWKVAGLEELGRADGVHPSCEGLR